MTTFGLIIAGCWVGFVLGLLFSGSKGMMSGNSTDSQGRKGTEAFDGGEISAAGYIH